MVPVMIQVVEEETPESFHCTIRDKRFWIPRAAINPETRCVLGECDVLIEIQWSLALEMGLCHGRRMNRDSGRPEINGARNRAATEHRHGTEPVGGVVTS